MLVAAVPDPWAFSPHPEVWLLVGGCAFLYVWAARRIGPRVVPAGQPVVTRRQWGWFVAALTVLWVSSDWPMHDIAEQHLYSVHMFQHGLITFVLPPLVYFATPEWLARLVIGRGDAYRRVRWITRPVPAAVLFNAVVLTTHWPELVNATVANGLLHYAVHTVVVVAAFIMWMPVCGPIPEFRISLPAQMVYLFLQTVLPTVPAGWLALADGLVYEAYRDAGVAFGITAVTDQQLAGLVMKLGFGSFLWGIIVVLFFRWAARFTHDDHAGAVTDLPKAGRPWPEAESVREGDGGAGAGLTWAEVQAELERAGPAPRDPTRPG